METLGPGYRIRPYDSAVRSRGTWQAMVELREDIGHPLPTAAAAPAVVGLVDRPMVRLAGAGGVVAIGCVAAARGDQSQIGQWGLIQALPPLYFVSLAILTVSFFGELFRPRAQSPLVLAGHVMGMVLLLHGAPGFLEQEPRFATAWLHAGFANQILDHGVTRPGVDARFNWPGFFGAAAAVTGASGLHSALPLLRWAPVFMMLLYLPSVFVIGRQLTGSALTAWLGLWLFLLVNWVGQDYFAPQSVGMVLYLSIIAILITFFRDGEQFPLGRRLSAWRTRLGYDGIPDVPCGPRTRVALVVVLIALTAALAMTHQLSPIGLVLASSLLVVFGRCRLVLFPVVAGILTLGWISVAATPYWLGHLDTMFGGLGNVNAVVDNAVGERIRGSQAHLTVIHTRLYFTAGVWVCMALAVIGLMLRRRAPITLAALAAAPFLTLVQNYGDEGVLRVFLFSSPFAALLVADLALTTRRRQAGRLAVLVTCLALGPLFVLTRFGNESYEQVRAPEVAAVRELYRIAPLGSTLVTPTTQVAWRFEHAADYKYERPRDPEGFLSGDPGAVHQLLPESSKDSPGTYLLVTTGQEIYASEAQGAVPDWFSKVKPMLTPANGYRLLFRNPDARVYEYEAPR
jgi:hypothetical protein